MTTRVLDLPRCTFIDPTGWECPTSADARYRRGFRQVHPGPLCARHFVHLKTAHVVRCLEGCGAEAIHQGRCREHEGIPLWSLSERGRAQLRADLLAVIRPDWQTDCWIFHQQTVDGYGRFRVKGGGVWLIHRLTWHLFYRGHGNGREDNPVQLDHLCNRPACCNPLHLRPATQAANLALRDLRADPSWDWRAEVARSPCPWPLVLFAARAGLPLDSSRYPATRRCAPV